MYQMMRIAGLIPMSAKDFIAFVGAYVNRTRPNTIGYGFVPDVRHLNTVGVIRS